MRAVNLIPADERRGARGAGGRSGGAAYVLLAVLAALVAVMVLHTSEKRSMQADRAELVALEGQATAARERTAQLTAFVQFAAERASRTQTVAALASNRFDWSHTLTELSRVMPRNVWLTGVQGTVTPGVTLKAAVGQGGDLRAALPVPAVELVGCTTSQRAVAVMAARMRLIDAVTRVTLQSSMKSNGGGGASGGNGGDCRQGSERFPQFGLVVFLDPVAGAVPDGRSTTTAVVQRNATAPATPGATP